MAEADADLDASLDASLDHGIIAVDKTDHLRSAACRVELLILGLP